MYIAVKRERSPGVSLAPHREESPQPAERYIYCLAELVSSV